ncbi:MAG: ribose 5-phosphate isomerase B [Erysipelotrichaceae bacterium]|nr:ribose 5-phosphate isomerase B [Erysipelotrichaceae bacterium]
MKIAIGNDHAGVEYKNELSKYIEEKYGYEVINFGTDTNDSCNYPEFGEKVANAVAKGEADRGVLICGTGIGIGISANKVNGIRCAICSETKSAEYTRLHNDANIISFGARIVSIETAKEIVDTFLTTEYEGGRHQIRVDMIKDIENRQR